MGAVLLTTAVLMFALAGIAAGDTIDQGSSSAGGWHITAPGLGGSTLTPSVSATYPCATPPCQNSQNLASVVVGPALAPIAAADALYAQAQAFPEPDADATLQGVMAGAAIAAGGAPLPTDWNTRGYGSATRLSALAGRVTASFVEAETVSAGANGSLVSASGARVVDLTIAGFTPGVALAPILPNTPNQVLLNAGGVRIVYWETNWDPATGTTTDGRPIFVNALRITEAATGIDIKVATATTNALRVPVARDDSATTTPGTAVVIDVDGNDSDADGNLRRDQVIITQNPSNGTLTCDNQSNCTYTPNAGFIGVDTFTYRICDTTGLCDTAVVTITVAAPAPTNRPPDARNDYADTTVGTATSVDILLNDTDPDGDTLTITAASGPTTNGSYTCSATSCTYTPDAGFTGTDTFTYEICDGKGGCDTATVTVTVTDPAAPGGGVVVPVNRAPDAANDYGSGTMGSIVTVPVDDNDSDPDNDALTVTTDSGTTTSGGVYSCDVDACAYTPAANFVGTDTFTYEICDPSNACAIAIVTVTITAPTGTTGPTNAPPVARDDSGQTAAGSPVTIPVMGNDSDVDGNLLPNALAWTPPSNGAAVCQAGSCTYTPNAGFVGPDSFEYRICDDKNACSIATVTVTVTAPPDNNPAPSNNPPVAQNDSFTTPGGTPVVITVLPNDSDPDGNLDRSSVTVTAPPQHGAVICANGACTYTPEPGYSGPDSFEYRVCDTNNTCDTAVVTIIVGDGDGDADSEPPVARDDAVTTRPGRPVIIDVTNNDGDPDGDLDPGSVMVTVPPEHGSVICVEGKCTYTPEPGFTGTDGFEYRVCDSLGACTIGEVTITVPAPNPDIDEGGPGGPGDNNGGEGNGNPDDGNAGGGNGLQVEPDPATPGEAPPNAPVGLDSPLLGAPNAPLPFTGGEPSFYVGAALNLLLLGMGLLLTERFARATRMRRPCPTWHNHAEAHNSNGCAYGEWS